jgi:type III restriction enzyme
MKNINWRYPSTLTKAAELLEHPNTVIHSGDTAEIYNYISLKTVHPQVTNEQPFSIPKKSIFNKAIDKNPFESEFTFYYENRFAALGSFAKNTMGDGVAHFKIEYQAEDGNIREYFLDFFVKTSDKTDFIVETKGRKDLDSMRKIRRLAQWCKDVNAKQSEKTYTAIFIKQEDWEKHKSRLKTCNTIKAISPAE